MNNFTILKMVKQFGPNNSNQNSFSDESDDTSSTDDSESSFCYNDNEHSYLRLIYLCAILVWVAIIYLLNLLPPRNIIEMLILLIPPAVFLIALLSVHTITESVEELMLKANLLTLGLLVALPLINWSRETTTESKATFINIAATAIILSMITLLDFWVNRKYVYLVKHFKSILQTYAIVLLIAGLFRFFCECAYDKAPVGSGGIFSSLY